MTRLVRTTAIAMFLVLAPGVHGESRACDRRDPTRAVGLGPHDFSSAPEENRLWREGDEGQSLLLRARVLDTCGRPVAGARVHLLHADQDGHHDPDRWRAILRTDERGEIEVLTVYPGYAGSIQRHIHFIVSHPDHRELVTRLFFKNDPAHAHADDDLAMILEEVRRGEKRGWIAGFEFVLDESSR